MVTDKQIRTLIKPINQSKTLKTAALVSALVGAKPAVARKGRAVAGKAGSNVAAYGAKRSFKFVPFNHRLARRFLVGLFGCC